MSFDPLLNFSQLFEIDFTNLRKKETLKYKLLCKQVLRQSDQLNLQELALSIIKRACEERYEEEIAILQIWTKNFDFFQTLNSKQSNINMKLHEKCCQRMKYESFQAGQTVFWAGELPEKFYIILTGAVNVMILKKEEDLHKEIDEEINKKQKKKQRMEQKSNFADNNYHKDSVIIRPFERNQTNATVNSNQDLQNTPQSSTHMQNDKMLDEQDEYYKLLGSIPLYLLEQPENYFKEGILKYKYLLTLYKGKMFGELGLLLKKPRAATILAQQTCECAVLSANDYRRILQEAEMKKINDKINFFAKYMLQQCGRDLILKYSYNFEKKKFNRGAQIYVEGEGNKGVYLIKKGIIEISKKIREDEDTHKYLYTQMSQKNILQGMQQKTSLSNMSKKDKFYQISISTLEQGQIFGEVEVIKNMYRECTATCHSSNATIYFLSSQHFLRLLNENKQIQNSFKDQVLLKEQWVQLQIKHFLDQKQLSKSQSSYLNKTMKEFTSLKPSQIFHSNNNITKTNNSPIGVKSKSIHQSSSNENLHSERTNSQRKINLENLISVQEHCNKYPNKFQIIDDAAVAYQEAAKKGIIFNVGISQNQEFKQKAINVLQNHQHPQQEKQNQKNDTQSDDIELKEGNIQQFRQKYGLLPSKSALHEMVSKITESKLVNLQNLKNPNLSYTSQELFSVMINIEQNKKDILNLRKRITQFNPQIKEQPSFTQQKKHQLPVDRSLPQSWAPGLNQGNCATTNIIQTMKKPTHTTPQHNTQSQTQSYSSAFFISSQGNLSSEVNNKIPNQNTAGTQHFDSTKEIPSDQNLRQINRKLMLHRLTFYQQKKPQTLFTPLHQYSKSVQPSLNSSQIFEDQKKPSQMQQTQKDSEIEIKNFCTGDVSIYKQTSMENQINVEKNTLIPINFQTQQKFKRKIPKVKNYTQVMITPINLLQQQDIEEQIFKNEDEVNKKQKSLYGQGEFYKKDFFFPSNPKNFYMTDHNMFRKVPKNLLINKINSNQLI